VITSTSYRGGGGGRGKNRWKDGGKGRKRVRGRYTRKVVRNREVQQNEGKSNKREKKRGKIKKNKIILDPSR